MESLIQAIVIGKQGGGAVLGLVGPFTCTIGSTVVK
jgi:hypothetical protein